MAIGACISLLVGFIIAMNPQMTLINIWIFTGIALIIEGVFDAIAMVLLAREHKGTGKAIAA